MRLNQPGETSLGTFLLMVVGLIVAVVNLPETKTHALDTIPPPAPAASKPTSEGHLYIVVVNHAWASALKGAAASIRKGGKISEAQVQADKEYSAASRAEFAKRFGPALSAIVPEGKEPATPEERETYAQELEQIAAGADEVK